MESIHPRTAYFYAGSEADLYDATARMTERSYDAIHEVASRCLNALVEAQPTQREMVVLDLGCGTGEEAFRVLELLPTARLICVDISSEMLDIFRQRAITRFGERSLADRFIWLRADFRDEENVVGAVRAEVGSQELDAVISVYALHHLETRAKQDVYSYISHLLRPGQPFINADLFSYQSGWAANLAQIQEEQWLQSMFTNPDEWTRAGLSIDESRARALLESWMIHLRQDNKPLPLFGNDGTVRGATTDTEVQLLHRAGFGAVECMYRLYQSGVVIASK